jgi:nitric oxide reductase subunit B
MTVGSIWGHGAYQAPDWTADWLHRELSAWLDLAAQAQYGLNFAQLDGDAQAVLQRRLKEEYRKNTYDPATGVVTVSDRRAKAIAETASYYDKLFGDDASLHSSRKSFAMKEGTLPSPEARARLANFFFWTAWAASTDRPGTEASYTNNWPHEPLIDNVPTAENIIWSVMSVIILIAGVGLLVWAWAFTHKEHDDVGAAPARDPVLQIPLTASQRALGKYLFLVVALFVSQIFIGGFTAHYTVEGQTFYGINVSEWLPYSLVRTWHIQAALFWIATGFLAIGLFVVPILNGGKDPKHQKLGVDVLFWALILVVVGSFTGNFAAIAHLLPAEWNFWLGHQGYEYVELGRLWQIGKFLGIVFWLFLMLRGIVPALKQKGDKNLLALFSAAVICIGLFYGAGLAYGEKTHLSVMEYWRWWVVHLWVEGFFEVFATTALAFIFSTMGLVSKRGATIASLSSAVLFMLGGTPGTLHHLYFSGTTTPIMAIAASFSALEVVPLVVLGYEAWENWRLKERAPWMENLRWPLKFFVAVAFWNMFGAGVFGFMVNPPIALYYIQGLNTTAVHAHAALFGVYGFLALGFTLFVLRYLRPSMQFNESLMKTAFWCMNIGLVMMISLSLLPIGLMQFHASYSVGTWWARGEAFMQQDILQTLRWTRTFGDVVFIVGGLGVMWQVVTALFDGKAAAPAVDAGLAAQRT